MPGKTIGAALLLAAICGLPGWGQPHRGGLAGPALELGLQGQAELTREEGRPLKAQAAGTAWVRGEVPLLPFAALGLGLDAHDALGSSLAGGWQYSGHLGVGLRLYGRLGLPLSVTPAGRHLYLGGATGASLNYDRYAYTELHFFYPGWFLEPQLELQLRPGGRSGLALALPLDVYFRKDLEVSAAVGLGVGWRLYRKEKR
jgi:hypothetical protein